MPARIRLSLIAGVFLLVNACASVPLGTMWALRDFHPSDLAKIEPSDIRIATLVQPGPQQLDVTKSGLVLELTPHDAGEVQTYRFGLMPAASGDSAIPPGEHDAGWQGFALEPDGVTAFRALQPRLATVQDDYKGIILRVDFGLHQPQLDARPEYLEITTRLRLAPDQKTLTLLDRARIRVTYEDP